METITLGENKMKDIIKGETIEDKMKHLNVLLKRMYRKLQKTVTGIITPFPISGYAKDPVDSVVLRYMFPASGKITVGGAYIENMPKEGIDIYTNIHRGDSVLSSSIWTNKKYALINPDVEILAGDRLVVSVVPKGGDVSGIWASFLWVPKVEDSEIKQFLIDDLERIGEENVGEEQTT